MCVCHRQLLCSPKISGTLKVNVLLLLTYSGPAMVEVQYFLIDFLTSKLDYIKFSDHYLQCSLPKQLFYSPMNIKFLTLPYLQAILKPCRDYEEHRSICLSLLV